MNERERLDLLWKLRVFVYLKDDFAITMIREQLLNSGLTDMEIIEALQEWKNVKIDISNPMEAFTRERH